MQLRQQWRLQDMFQGRQRNVALLSGRSCHASIPVAQQWCWWLWRAAKVPVLVPVPVPVPVPVATVRGSAR